MFKRTKYQQGCLTREERKSGKDVWIFRWRETNANGQRENKKRVVGTVEQYRTQTAAAKAVAALRLEINKESQIGARRAVSVEQLIAHYDSKELQDVSNKAYSTRASQKSYLHNWILPRWGSYLLEEVKPVPVEDWLAVLPRARGTKAKIRNIMSALFNHAMRYEWLDKNPIKLVRQSAKRENAPQILTVEELKKLLSALEEPYKTMVFLDAATGLRVSELLALRWGDINFEGLEIYLARAIVHQVIGELKTEASRKPIPLDSALAEALQDWRSRTPFNQREDWLFASPEKGGKQPYWPENLLRRHIRPAAKLCGIQKTIGWHTFRHTFATLLKANGEDVKVVQESLRHANSRITLDTYTQAITPAKRQAQSKVVTMILPSQKATMEVAGGM